jgi:glycerol uptake facilitator protein
MSKFLAEVLGTMFLILLGDGVVANVVLKRTKGNSGGWIVITTGWGLAVAVAVYLVGRISGAHLNPAVTIALAVKGDFPWDQVFTYILGQMLGAFIGACLVYLAYLPHWEVTEDPDVKLAVFCTGPAIRSYSKNLLTEIIGTFVLILGVLGIGANKLADGLNPLLVGFLVWSIGLSLGGPTGYAINPARDLGPRIAHALLPIPGKRDSDWSYAWVPVVGPIIGGILGVLLYSILF